MLFIVVSDMGWSDVGKFRMAFSGRGAADVCDDYALSSINSSSFCVVFESLWGLDLAVLHVDGVEDPAKPSNVLPLAAGRAAVDRVLTPFC